MILVNGLHLGAVIGVTLRYSMADELMEEFQSVHMDMTIFRKGAHVRTVPGKSSAGKIC